VRFKELLNLRFGPAVRSAPLFELSECRHIGTVEEYSNRFQTLLPRAGRLDQEQRVQLYTDGLLPPLSHQVRVHAPASLAEAMILARQLELVELDRLNQAVPRAAAQTFLPAPVPRQAAPAVAVLPMPAQPMLPAPKAPLALLASPTREGGQATKRLLAEEQAERRCLDLCYNCNEPYLHGHNRVCRSIFFIDSFELAEAEAREEAPVFSLHTVAGVAVASTIQLRVHVGSAAFTMLVDTGSTHSFIGETTAQRAGMPVQTCPRQTASVANGEHISCPGVLRQAPVVIEGLEFRVELYVMPLAGYDIVLGTNWMAPLGDIVWNVVAGTMAFKHARQDVSWRDTTPLPTPRLHAATPVTEPLLDELLDAFEDVFAAPSGLPPTRGRAHHITLKPGSAPVAVRPYRYPATHKDELERQCAAMMEQGIVRHSDSAFSSPVLLVKKPDGSWRFCVDYRTLNAIMMKDAYPILVVDELLDEVHGAQFFTKLDLRSGYHQVQMWAHNVHKTAFRTHDSLYEFLVMSFGLCNAPATFQALMNDVLRPFLRSFVLVFFDDILIYSKSWADHLRHLHTVLTELHRHTLFVKRSKCAFGVPTVAYLGHTISAAGVAMDSAKV
jgi:hypothetical protein